jgi:uncharacterized membrane protein YbaN (DUF454 family)
MRQLWLLLGLITFFLGVIGILLPILPTTPFFIVTTYSLSKGSKKINLWFHSLTITQKYLKPIQLTKKRQWTLLLTVDFLLIGYMIIFDYLYIRIIIIFTIFIKHYVFYKFVPTSNIGSDKNIS